MAASLKAKCDWCGAEHALGPGASLPASGGALGARDDPVRGWQIESFVCGPCWEGRRHYWICPHCGNGGEEWALACRGCGRDRPGLPPYQPDWDAIGKEMEERRHEEEALLTEAIREYRSAAVFGSGRRRDRL